VEETFARFRLVRIGSRGQQEGSKKMRSNRRRNWLIKRIALGFAVAAFVAPVAQARVDEGIQGQPNSSAEVIRSSDYQPFVTDFPSYANVVDAADYVGIPRATPMDYAISRGDLIEVVRSTPNATSSDKIEFVRTQPRSIGEPQVVAVGFDWKDAGIGAGLALALVLLGGGAVLASRHVGRAQTA
jgi:hypothetical protein